MSAIFCLPLRFTVSNSTGWQSIAPVTNLNIDEPGLVARSSGSTASFTVNLGSSQKIDTVALVGANLPSTASVTVTAGSYNSGPVPAYYGVKDAETTTKTILQFPPVTTSTVTVQITSSAPIQIERLVIGKRVETEGIDQGCSQSFEDQSVIETSNGHTTIERFNVLTSWKAKMSWVGDSQWRQEFFGLFKRAGQSRAVLFVPTADDPATFQHEAVFGRFTSVAKGDYNNHNNWVAEFTITALAD